MITIGLLWAGGESVEGRVVAIRMFLFFGSALIAFITPYMLYPDPNAPILQLGNIAEGHLFRHLLQRSSALWGGSVIFMAAVCFVDLSSPLADLQVKLFYFLYGSLFFSGLMIYSICRYTRSGISSQFWKESERGKEMRTKMGDYFKYPIDPGSIPSFINTVVVGGLGMLAVSAGAGFYGGFGMIYEGIAAVVILVFSVYAVGKLLSNLLVNYYASNAFFNEFFGETIAGQESVARIKVNQLWWVPGKMKSHVWALLLQLDRKFPAGRLLFVGHLLVWLLSYQRPSEDVMISAWLLFALFHHVIIFVALSDRYAPGWFRRWIGSSFEWILVRAWIQLRWILILSASMLFNGWIFGHLSYTAQGGIMLLYVVSALLISLSAHIYQTKTSATSYD